MAFAHRFFATTHSRAPLILRLTVGGVLLPHGSQKLLGLFGGDGYSSTLVTFKQYLHVSPVLTTLVIIGEFFGSLAMILGLCTRFVAVSFILIMTGAIVLVHWNNGFFMNWFGKQAGEGFEYHLLVIGMNLSLLASGGGAFSLDRWISARTGPAFSVHNR